MSHESEAEKILDLMRILAPSAVPSMEKMLELSIRFAALPDDDECVPPIEIILLTTERALQQCLLNEDFEKANELMNQTERLVNAILNGKEKTANETA